ncbi:DUF7674 family protein [Aurantibacillus circumpalustris]|uniref:DUF7674 family protein n=1 Tax=Aurantibacillus circumpalustris TaxID=3036359 RepID=UPI00295B9762|nr:hypothetical protein [Aurantibacillus circumpalustris]
MNALAELLKIKADFLLKNKLIKENEILEILGNELPEINQELEKLSSRQNIYSAIKCFAEFTKQLIKKGNLSEVKHCFNVAEKMLLEGNKTVKNAIENVYIFSMSSVLGFTSPMSYKIKGIMNKGLLNEYNRQAYASGI